MLAAIVSGASDMSGILLAYIGPGAGFAFVGSLFVLLSGLALTAVAVLTWPFRAVVRVFRRRKRRRTNVRRVIILGLDGLDPRRCERLMDEGRLPHLSGLRATGSYRRLASTCPPISPVAWSTFMTGANPGKHGIFDFLHRSPRTYLPELSSSRVETGPRGRQRMQGLRRSKPFWHVLGEHGVFSAILRVPVTFPPEPFRGVCLSGMCVPDLRGTQGSFTFYTDEDRAAEMIGGRVIRVRFNSGVAESRLPGPPVPGADGKELELPVRIRRNDDSAILRIAGQKIELRRRHYSDWVRVTFNGGVFRKVSGLCRFLLVETRPRFRLYVTPINIDPERPAMPVSHPAFHSVYLAKLLGPFATLGLAEDTWARNEDLIDDDAFLEQVDSIHDERERMFFATLDRVRGGACVCVFDAPDRIQHIFTRENDDGRGESVIADMYACMDDLVGRTVQRMTKDDVLIVLSDHGFGSFRRGVNLNAWLRGHGFLAVLRGKEDEDYLRSVDWTRTKAYAIGLSGVYINRAGREAQGIVGDGEYEGLKRELGELLGRLRDDAPGTPAIREVYDADLVYRGPYRARAPDLIIGYADGYRASWDGAIGGTSGPVLSDNDKAWSGDHCIDRELVPGVLFSSRRLGDTAACGLEDVAPTVLDLFGIPVPGYMDGRVLPLQGAESGRSVR